MEKRKAMRRNSRKESRKIQMLSEEERYVQAITALLTFGVFRYIVLPLLDDLSYYSAYMCVCVNVFQKFDTNNV
jgi:hypothetical protein